MCMHCITAYITSQLHYPEATLGLLIRETINSSVVFENPFDNTAVRKDVTLKAQRIT